MTVSEFKATCLRVFDEIQAGGESIVVTRRGVPVAQVGPPDATAQKRKLGAMAGTARILGDIMVPSSELVEWDALK